MTLGEDHSFPYDQVGGFLQSCAASGTVPGKTWVPLGIKDFTSFISQMPDNIDALYVNLVAQTHLTAPSCSTGRR